MKASEIREMSTEEQKVRLTELQESLFNLRFQQGMGQLENPQKMKQTRREIARIKTILEEQKIAVG